MNYLTEINEFYRWLETHQLPGDAINLWHALMHINNGTMWQDSFTAAITTLESKTGCDRRKLYVARRILTETGRIKCKSNGSHQSARYTLISLSEVSGKRSIKKPEIFDPELEFIPSELNASQNQNDFQEDLPPSVSHSVPQLVPQSVSQPVPYSVPYSVPNNKEKEKEKKKKKKEPKGSMSSCDDLVTNVREIFHEYNKVCIGCIPAKILTDKRKHFIAARLKDYGMETVKKMLAIASKSDFLAGANRRKWVATLEFMFGPNNFVKVLEGTYNNRPTRSGDIFGERPSNLEIIEETFNTLYSE